MHQNYLLTVLGQEVSIGHAVELHRLGIIGDLDRYSGNVLPMGQLHSHVKVASLLWRKASRIKRQAHLAGLSRLRNRRLVHRWGRRLLLLCRFRRRRCWLWLNSLRGRLNLRRRLTVGRYRSNCLLLLRRLRCSCRSYCRSSWVRLCRLGGNTKINATACAHVISASVQLVKLLAAHNVRHQQEDEFVGDVLFLC